MKRICTALAFLACDPAAADLRDGPDEVLVGQQLISIADFAGVVDACDGVEEVKMTVTLTSYPLGAEHRVVGIGASTLAELALYECWRAQLVKLGADIQP